MGATAAAAHRRNLAAHYQIQCPPALDPATPAQDPAAHHRNPVARIRRPATGSATKGVWGGAPPEFMPMMPDPASTTAINAESARERG